MIDKIKLEFALRRVQMLMEHSISSIIKESKRIEKYRKEERKLYKKIRKIGGSIEP